MRTRTTFTIAILFSAIGGARSAAAQPIPPAQSAPSPGQPTQGQPGNSPAPGQYSPGQPGQYPQGQPGTQQYPQGQPAPQQYQQAPASQYPQGQPAPGQYPQGQPGGQYQQRQPGQYPQGQPAPGQSPQQGGPGRAPPGDPTVETLDATAPPAPAQGESSTGPDLAWYKPISADVALEDRSHERFVSGIFNAHTFMTGPIRGTGSEVLATFHFNSIWGVGVGAYLPNGSFVMGLDMFRYAGINLPTKKRSFGLTVLLPTLEMRFATGTNVFYAGSGLTGLRVTACPIVVDLRQPIPFDDASKPSISVGATASLGFMF
jgi:hypothetical protein